MSEAISGSGGRHAGNDSRDSSWVRNRTGREGAGTRSAGRGRAGITAESRIGATAENKRHLEDKCLVVALRVNVDPGLSDRVPKSL